MPRGTWSAKRERQYEHIKDSLLERGKDEDTAEEIAARTVNKERAPAQSGRRCKGSNGSTRTAHQFRQKALLSSETAARHARPRVCWQGRTTAAPVAPVWITHPPTIALLSVDGPAGA